MIGVAIGIVACGHGKDSLPPIYNDSDKGIDNTTETVDNDTSWGTVEIITEDEFSYGTVKDFSKTDGCGFVIELNDPNSSLRILEPFTLDEKFQVDGLKIKFSFTPSRRPRICPSASTPITINSIETI